MEADLIQSLPLRRGHFLLESGYHTDLWFTLDTLFLDPEKIAEPVGALAELLRRYQVSAVCGPLMGGAFLAQALAAHMHARFYYSQPAEPRAANDAILFGAEYVLPKGLSTQVRDERVAIVDDFISAGSSVRATRAALTTAGATTAVIGSLMLLGDESTDYFAKLSIPVVSVARKKFNLWSPEKCPLCQTDSPLEARLG